MYALSPSYLGMTREQQDNFRDVLKSFYKVALYDIEEFEEFDSGFRKINTNNVDDKLIENLTNYISNYVNQKNEFTNTQSFTKKQLKNTSKILAVIISKDSNLLKKLKQGGRHNFINYVELTIAENLAKDNSLKVILQYEKQETMKSARQIQYYRYNSPDQILR